ncbi:hypothetical protein ACFY4C_42040 [Actinomadura viridis]
MRMTEFRASGGAAFPGGRGWRPSQGTIDVLLLIWHTGLVVMATVEKLLL